MIALLSVDRIAWIEIVGTPLLVHVVLPRCILKLGIVSMYRQDTLKLGERNIRMSRWVLWLLGGVHFYCQVWLRILFLQFQFVGLCTRSSSFISLKFSPELKVKSKIMMRFEVGDDLIGVNEFLFQLLVMRPTL